MAKASNRTESSSTPAGQSQKEYLDHLKKVNDVFYDQTKIADQKAAYIFTFMVALLISSSEGRNVFQAQRYVEGSWPLIVLSAIMVAATVLALVSAILVVLPRRAKGTTSLFWGAWHSHRADLLKAAEAAKPDYLFNEYLLNIDTLATIAHAKYRFVTLAFRALVVMSLAYLALLALPVA